MKFKGRTIIELKDVNTGEVKKYEDENMMTNAIGKMMGFATTHALGTSSLNIYTSHWENLLGGLVLFDAAITESADTIYPPAGAKPIGYGQRGNENTYASAVEWGVYNSQESDTSASNMKKMVWDFSTSHANGAIYCVSLTHKNAGLFGFGMENYSAVGGDNYGKIAVGTIITQSSKGKQSRNTTTYGSVGTTLATGNGTYVDFCIDSANDDKYMFKVCGDGISVIKHKLYPEQIDVFSSATSFQSYVEETYAGTFSGSYFYHCYNPDEKVLYFWTLSSDVQRWQNTAVSVAIHKFDMTSKTLTENWKTFATSASQHIYNNFIVTSAGIYFARYADSKIRIAKFNTSSGSVNDVWESGLSYTNTGLIGRRSYVLNGLIHFSSVISYGSSKYYDIVVDTADDTGRITNTYNITADGSAPGRYGVCISPYDNTQVVFGTMLNADEQQGGLLNLQASGSSYTQYLGNVFAPIAYLGTINNLAQPIVKNNSQTMKVTYIISVEEE